VRAHLVACRPCEPLLSNFCADVDSNTYYLVEELVTGTDLYSLAQLQPECRFNEMAARFFICQVALALQYLHSLKVVYRDIKPENIMVQADGYIKVYPKGALYMGPTVKGVCSTTTVCRSLISLWQNKSTGRHLRFVELLNTWLRSSCSAQGTVLEPIGGPWVYCCMSCSWVTHLSRRPLRGKYCATYCVGMCLCPRTCPQQQRVSSGIC
jgi:hypothetical protein